MSKRKTYTDELKRMRKENARLKEEYYKKEQ